ncbi:E3 ubiquitin-protein ligase WAV3 [Spinacia oleracea]|uniref:E3 ubiquitin-protein ligase WAV3 n=1 Tax=Spinacia oleracea TaxID=3562 RepID=A0A9R0HQT9_SPIOL|nr:E3 ubiquitin-protein ligase WAV3 [Spinacia oleracea]
MGTGWRKAFCSTIPKDREKERPTHRHHNNHRELVDVLPIPTPTPTPTPKTRSKLSLFSSISNPSTPKTRSKLSLFSSISNPSTPRLRVRTTTTTVDNTTTTTTTTTPTLTPNSSGKLECKLGSNPSSPRSPFAILRNTLRLTKNGCGLCMQSVKTGKGMAIYTAECSHTFHFPCIAAHVRKQGCLICPVCNVTWKDVPLLSLHNNNNNNNNPAEADADEIIEKKTIISTTTHPAAMSAPATPTGSARIHFEDKRLVKRSPYNDDEPLLSPRFDPIPEAEGEDADDTEEFQGFFVASKKPATTSTTTTSKSSVDPYNSVNVKKPPPHVEVKLLPEAAVVSGSRTHETYAVALRVKAPPTPEAILSPTHRAPIDLVTVLDVSGSMTGPKLLMLKRAMRLVISSLSSADRLAIVAFSSAPQRLLPLRRMTSQGQKSARKIIDHLSCGQGTSVGEALTKAAKVLEDRRQKNPVCTIILLSDGQDDLPTSNQRQRQRQRASKMSSTQFAHIEIPVHPSGFGFRTPETKQDAFAKCVGGLLSVVVQDLRVQLGFASGSASAEIMAVYSCNGRPSLMSSDSARLGDLYAEEERELLIEVKVPMSASGAHHVMSVRCSYKDPVTKEVMYGRERALLVPRPHAIRSSDPRIERLRNLFIYTRAVAESRRLVEHYDFSSAHHLLSSARALILQSSANGLTSAEEYAKGLECELGHVHWRKQYQVQKEQEAANVVQHMVDENGDPLTPKSAWRTAEQLAKVAKMKKSLNRSVSDLLGFENARF